MVAEYDIIGLNYAELRKPCPRIAAAIQQALVRANTVLNVGAGTGSYGDMLNCPLSMRMLRGIGSL